MDEEDLGAVSALLADFSTRINDIEEKTRLLTDHGIESEEKILIPGTNAKMDEFQAAMGLCNLEIIDKLIEQRKNIYN